MTRDWTQEYFDIKGDEPDAYEEIKSELTKVKQQLAIAVKSLSTITNCAPACFQTEECPLEGGCGFDNGCFRCGYATAFEALQQIKELEK